MGHDERISLVAIVGTDRSGSTLLDRVISANPEFTGVGEIHRYAKYIQGDMICTCGKEFRNCRFWNAVQNEVKRVSRQPFNSEYVSVLGWKRRVRMLAEHILLGGHVRSFPNSGEFASNFADLCRAIAAVKDTKYIVDSSKDAARIGLLYNSDLFNIYPIYITRPVEDYIISARTPQMVMNPGRKRTAMLSILRWTYRNVETEYYMRKIDSNFLRVTYHQFATQPFKTLDLIAARTGLPVTYEPQRIRDTVSHSLGGNNMRFRQFNGISLDTKPDVKTLLPRPTIFLTKVLNSFFVRQH